MSDIWSRAWCQTQQIPNFHLQGISELNVVRDSPNYIPRVISEPTQYGCLYDSSHSPSPESNQLGSLCFQFRRRKTKNKEKERVPIRVRKPRNVLEKVPNFKAPTDDFQSISKPPSPVGSTEAPSSPGCVKIRKTLSRTPSTVSSGFTYRISSCSLSPPPTPSSGLRSPQPTTPTFQVTYGTESPDVSPSTKRHHQWSPISFKKPPTPEALKKNGSSNNKAIPNEKELMNLKSFNHQVQYLETPIRNCSSRTPPMTPSSPHETKHNTKQLESTDLEENVENRVRNNHKTVLPTKCSPVKKKEISSSVTLDKLRESDEKQAMKKFIVKGGGVSAGVSAERQTPRNLENGEIDTSNNLNKDRNGHTGHNSPSSVKQSHMAPNQKYLVQNSKLQASTIAGQNVSTDPERISRKNGTLPNKIKPETDEQPINERKFGNTKSLQASGETEFKLTTSQKARQMYSLPGNHTIQSTIESKSSRLLNDELRQINPLTSRQIDHTTLDKNSQVKSQSKCSQGDLNHDIKNRNGKLSYVEKKHGYVFVGQRGCVLAQSKSSISQEKVIVKRVRSSLRNGPSSSIEVKDKTNSINSEEEFEVDKIEAWQKLKEISSKLESERDESKCTETKCYPCKSYNQVNNSVKTDIGKGQTEKSREMFAVFGKNGHSLENDSSGAHFDKALSSQQKCVKHGNYVQQKKVNELDRNGKLPTAVNPHADNVSKIMKKSVVKTKDSHLPVPNIPLHNIPDEGNFDSQASEDLSDADMPNLQKLFISSSPKGLGTNNQEIVRKHFSNDLPGQATRKVSNDLPYQETYSMERGSPNFSNNTNNLRKSAKQRNV